MSAEVLKYTKSFSKMERQMKSSFLLLIWSQNEMLLFHTLKKILRNLDKIYVMDLS